jgi:DNA-binding response OmpR family regulator
MSTALLVPQPEVPLERHLANDGFEVVRRLDAAERIDLALLPSIEECRLLRRAGHDVPVIVLGGPETDAVDRIRALEDGADDVLARPFLYEELLARIRAVLRRASHEPHERLTAGDLRLDRATRRVTVRGEPVALAGKEFELLLKLASDPYRVFTKEQLLREVWGFRSLGRTRTLDSHASRLRRKLAFDGAGPFVVNVWGVGYKLLDG